MPLKLACSEERFWETSPLGWNQQEKCMLTVLGSLCYRSLAAQIFQPSEFASETWALTLQAALVTRGERTEEQEGLVCRSQVEVTEKKRWVLSCPSTFFFPFGSGWWFSKINAAYLFRELLFKKKKRNGRKEQTTSTAFQMSVLSNIWKFGA